MAHTKQHKKSRRLPLSKRHHLTKRNHLKNKKKYNKKSKKHTKKQMRGGMMEFNKNPDLVFVPKGVPFVPPGGGSNSGVSDGKLYYSLAQPSLHAPNSFLEQSYAVQNGGGLIPKPIVDLGRQIVYHFQNTTNTLVGGQNLPVSYNPSELAQPISSEQPKYDVTPVDMNKIRTDAVQKAANVV